MSAYNKATDRDLKGRINRKYTRKEKHWRKPNKWFRKLYSIRPKRRINKVLCIQVMKRFNLDSLVYPLGNNKPHQYHN
jgi:adenosyl cobinamide kinase/adenosyl cobinamide phosphate guanylyltransferase